MRKSLILCLLPAIASCANAPPIGSSAERSQTTYRASIVLNPSNPDNELVVLNIGQPYSATGAGYRMTVSHNRSSMVSNADGLAADYKEYPVNEKQARSTLHDLKNEANRVANYVRRVVIFAEPIQKSGNVDRVFIEAYCSRAVDCDVADVVAKTVVFSVRS